VVRGDLAIDSRGLRLARLLFQHTRLQVQRLRLVEQPCLLEPQRGAPLGGRPVDEQSERAGRRLVAAEPSLAVGDHAERSHRDRPGLDLVEQALRLAHRHLEDAGPKQPLRPVGALRRREDRRAHAQHL
jgi:hypothetical protein